MTGGTRLRRWIIVVATTFALLPSRAVAQQIRPLPDSSTSTAPIDSAGSSSGAPIISRREIAAGLAAVAATAALAPFDRTIQRGFQDAEWQDNGVLRNTSSTLAFAGGPGPFLASGALYAGGRLFGRPRMEDAGVDLMEGVVLAAAIDGLGKGISGRALPNSSPGHPGNFSFGRGFHDGNGPFVSFPSGHTAAAFATAAVLTSEVARSSPESVHIVAPLAYGAATLVGVARLYQNVHWASDLPLGAAIGIWSGEHVVAWNHRRPRNAIERWLLGLSATPNTHGGATIAWSTPSEASVRSR